MGRISAMARSAMAWFMNSLGGCYRGLRLISSSLNKFETIAYSRCIPIASCLLHFKFYKKKTRK